MLQIEGVVGESVDPRTPLSRYVVEVITTSRTTPTPACSSQSPDCDEGESHDQGLLGGSDDSHISTPISTAQKQELELELEQMRMQRVLASLRGCCMTSHLKMYPAGALLHVVPRQQWSAALASSSLSSGVVITPSPPLTPCCHPSSGASAGAMTGREYVCSTQQEGASKGHRVCTVRESGQYVVYLADQRGFSELQLSGAMLADHAPGRYLQLLLDLFPSTNTCDD